MSSGEGSLAAALQGVTLPRATAGRAPAFFHGAKHGSARPNLWYRAPGTSRLHRGSATLRWVGPTAGRLL